MAADAKARRSVRVESADIAGTKMSSTDTSPTVTAGGFGSLCLGSGCRAQAASVVFADVRDSPLEAIVISVFDVGMAWISEK